MKNKIIAFVKIFLSTLICVIFIGIFASTAYDTISMDVATRGTSYQEGEVLADAKSGFLRKDNKKVLKVLRNISDENITGIQSDIVNIINDKDSDSETKEYFTQLESDIESIIVFDEAVVKGKQKRVKNIKINTNFYIKKSYVINRLFANSAKETRVLYSSIIPYFFIKHYNYSQTTKSFQREQLVVYNNFIHTFIDGKTSLNNACANVFCLYVYACYSQNTNMRSDTYLKLKSQIDRFINNFASQMSEGGNMDIYKDYLSRAKKVIDQYVKDNGALFGSLRTSFKRAFNIDTLEPFSKNNL